MNVLISRVLSPKIIPVKPPEINVDTKAIEKSIAGLSCKFPFHKVVI